MTDDEHASKVPSAREQTPSAHDPAGQHEHDPCTEAVRHDPWFPSWRYAGLRWLADRLYRGGNPKG